MKLYEIQEPAKQPKSDAICAVGIDLGTTNSLIGVYTHNGFEIIPDEYTGLPHTPSIVGYSPNGVIVGEAALKLASNNVIMSAKRLMGNGLAVFGDKKISPIQVSSEILKTLKARAEKFLNKNVTHAVITVPAHFDDAARQATKDAARIAGLEVLRLINEPTAAAVAYGLDSKPEGIYAVYDLGGGTFDVTILRMQHGIFQVLATGGDSNFGGDDLDKALLDYLLKKYKHKEVEFMQAVIAVRSVKEALSNTREYKGFVPFIDSEIQVTEKEFEALISESIEKTLRVFKACIKDAEITKNDIQEIILVGGATRTPLIRKILREFLGKEPLSNIDPDKIVAIGAAVQAHSLTQGGGGLLLDVTPLSLGIEVANGLVERLIFRNSPIPCSHAKTFTTQKDGQTGFVVHVVQGESDEISKCRSLAKFELKGIPKMLAGEARLEIQFKLDADGILSVSAKELQSGLQQEVEVKPTYGLSEANILKLIKDSL